MTRLAIDFMLKFSTVIYFITWGASMAMFNVTMNQGIAIGIGCWVLNLALVQCLMLIKGDGWLIVLWLKFLFKKIKP